MALLNTGAVHYNRVGTFQNKKQFRYDAPVREAQAAFAAMLAGLQTSCQGSPGAGNICRLMEATAAPGMHKPAQAQDYMYAALQATSRSSWYACLHDSPEDGSSDGEGLNSLSTPRLPRAYLSGSSHLQFQPGQLSEFYESGGKGVQAIGYDKVGGTSYGTYQISSKTGTMDEFIEFLDRKAPAWARRLREAGPADTGGIRGAMPQEWRRVATEDSARFARLQHEFISESHYQEALEQIASSNDFQVEQRSKALQEVLWSTSVQHGPAGAAEIFDSALERLQTKGAAISDKRLIEQIYARRSRQFGSSTAQVRTAVRQRLRQEKMAALALLRHENISVKI